MRDRVKPGLTARVYETKTDSAEIVTMDLADVVLESVEVIDGTLVGPAATVISRAVLVETDSNGELCGVPLAPLVQVNGGLCFEPRAGGVRTRENRRAAGGYNADVTEATRFGMVNALYHVEKSAKYLNGILGELGVPPLPSLTVVVGAHAGSRLPGFAQGDGDYRPGGIRPLTGGHYRLSSRTTGISEPFLVSPQGEVHLGPGRQLIPFAGHAAYLRNAAHNPATIYHEFGHHLCRHTADFRLNAERAPEQQRNGKVGPEEGICDYFAASLLSSGRPYGWYRTTRGERRDPDVLRRWDEDEEGDAHVVGAVWAATFWHSRQQLLNRLLIAGPRDHDRVILRALVQVGAVARPDADRRPRRVREAHRNAPETVIAAYVASLELEAGGPAADMGARIFAEAGLRGSTAAGPGMTRC